MTQNIRELLVASTDQHFDNWSVNTEYHFGGYAKYRPPLIAFINEFKQTFHTPLDPVYTGKLFYGIFDQIKKGRFPAESVIIAVHTGGLQGIRGFNERYGALLNEGLT